EWKEKRSIDVRQRGLKEFWNWVLFEKRCPGRGPAGLEPPGIQPHIGASDEREAGDEYGGDQGNPGLPGGGQAAPQPHDPLLVRSEEHTSELQSRVDLVCRLLLE